MSQDPFNHPNPRQRLISLRVIWMAMLLGQVIFFIVVATQITSQSSNSGPAPQLLQSPNYFYIMLALTLVLVSSGFVARSITYRRNPDGTVPAAKYVTGNIILFAMCEAPSFFGLVAMMLNHTFTPFIAIPVFAIIVQIACYPTGSNIDMSDA